MSPAHKDSFVFLFLSVLETGKEVAKYFLTKGKRPCIQEKPARFLIPLGLGVLATDLGAFPNKEGEVFPPS